MTKSTLEAREQDPTLLFVIENIIGRGQSSSVYRAKVKDTGQTVAIKMIEMNENENVFQDMEHEIHILESSVHPSIVEFYGAYYVSGMLWIAMELCEGGSVEHVFKTIHRAFTEEEIAVVCYGALQGLSYLHSLSIIHRDIKCSNILLTRSGEIRLNDFGVSTKLASRLSQRTFRGTIAYMAPEVLREEKYDSRADIWSLGIAAIEMAECSPPHITMHPMYGVLLKQEVSRPSLRQPKKWTSEFVDFIETCLQPAQEQRPTSYDLLEHPWIKKNKNASLKKLMNEYFHHVNMLEMDASSTKFPSATNSGSSKATKEPLNTDEKTHDKRKGMPFISLRDISFSALNSKLPNDVEKAIVNLADLRDRSENHLSDKVRAQEGYHSQLLRSFSRQFLFSRDVENNPGKAEQLLEVLEELIK